ncbi:hypothetical protein B0T21DRAFT_362790 [Apiosordaria backusii]|uniref:Uncharacterized protein n=1 Tax=Apiosordaria backusii TaxID=314023 RepID=A0AA40BSK3_9PEZI|nr:hypothetical protein B0T21DRAFT_362790 [Apiosordaria backusii]
MLLSLVALARGFGRPFSRNYTLLAIFPQLAATANPQSSILAPNIPKTHCPNLRRATRVYHGRLDGWWTSERECGT